MAELKADHVEFAAAVSSATLTVRTKLPDEHPYYAHIGRVSAEWARLEHILDLIIWDLSKSDNAILSCITSAIMGHGNRIRVIEALCEYRSIDQNIIKPLTAMKDALFKLSLTRNRIVHDAWFVEIDDDNTQRCGQFRSQIAKKHSFGFEEITDSYINNALTEIKSHTETILLVRASLLSALSPSQDK